MLPCRSRGWTGCRLHVRKFYQGVRHGSWGDAGWIAGAAGLASEQQGDAPHIILFPEIAFNKEKFLKKVQSCVRKFGYCAIVVSEGANYGNGQFLADAGSKDAFGHVQLGGVAPFVANMIKEALGYKYHWAVADYLQRAARHIASATDVEQAYAVGQAAVEFALAGKDAVMPTIARRPTKYIAGKLARRSFLMSQTARR